MDGEQNLIDQFDNYDHNMMDEANMNCVEDYPMGYQR
jgi:hypothetical protein